MKPWSDNPIHPNFKLRFFVDTNILSYLIDKSYSALSNFIDQAKDSPFIELVSSRYVIFEFVGIRKKEHYLRKIAEKSKIEGRNEINFSSLLRYQNKYEAPEAKFEDVIDDIKNAVEKEIDIISTTYKINFEYSILHEDQLAPTFEVCLSSKIANQDSLVLVSSILPQPRQQEKKVQLLTNDADFVKYCNINPKLEHAFQNFDLQSPIVLLIKDLPCKVGERNLDLTQELEEAEILSKLKDKIIKFLKEDNNQLYIGETFTPKEGFPQDVICFKAAYNVPFRTHIYITIIGKELDFLYTSKNQIPNVWYNGKPLADNFIFSNKELNNVSFKPLEVDEDGNHIPLDRGIIDSLKNEGNLVFIHPDSFL